MLYAFTATVESAAEMQDQSIRMRRDELTGISIQLLGADAQRAMSPLGRRSRSAGGVAFGYHTRSHRMLSRLDSVQQREELAGGVEWIRALTGQSSVPFCYPWGGIKTYTGETVRALGELGYSLAFNTVMRRLRIGHDDRYELPRLVTRDLPPYTQGEEDTQAPAMAEEW